VVYLGYEVKVPWRSERRSVSNMAADAKVERQVTCYDVPELGTVATVSEGPLCEVALIWGPEESMVDRLDIPSADAAHDLARRHAASLA
jgi:hypothetical protein